MCVLLDLELQIMTTRRFPFDVSAHSKFLSDGDDDRGSSGILDI